MSTVTRRQALMGAGALLLVVGGGYAMSAAGKQEFDAYAMTVDEMRANGGLIVDIRTPPEWAQTGVIDEAVLLTFDDPDRFLSMVGPALADGRDLILVCRSGNRSNAAAQKLAGRIGNRIISVDGGMRQIISQGYTPVPPG